jgi:lysophospholipase L1-like esterase
MAWADRTLRGVALAAALLALWAGAARAERAPCPSASLPRLSLPATRAALSANGEITIVALGSSSTAGAGASAPDRTYPARLEAVLRAAWPAARVRVLNRGIGGQEADDMAARIERDVLAAHPVLVIWQVGANAAMRHMDLGRFRAALRQGLDRLAASGADVVLMDNQLAPSIERVPDHARYGEAVAMAAEQHHDPLFSRTALMRQWRAAGAEGMIGPDGTHHTDHGYACLAAALGRAILAAASPPMLMAGGNVQ